jgi:hypothetical protein
VQARFAQNDSTEFAGVCVLSCRSRSIPACATALRFRDSGVASRRGRASSSHAAGETVGILRLRVLALPRRHTPLRMTIGAGPVLHSDLCFGVPKHRAAPRTQRRGWNGGSLPFSFAGSGLSMSRFTTTGSCPLRTTTASHCTSGRALIS